MYHLLLPGSVSMPVTEITRVVKARSKAGERLEVLTWLGLGSGFGLGIGLGLGLELGLGLGLGLG